MTQNSSPRGSALHSTLRVLLISLFTALLAYAAIPSRNQLEQKQAGAGKAAAHRHGAVSESAARKRTHAPKSKPVEISASRQSVGGREIAGFKAHTAEEENMTAPAGLKPVEEEAW